MIQIIGIGLIALFLFALQKFVYQRLWNKQLTADLIFAEKHIFEVEK